MEGVMEKLGKDLVKFSFQERTLFFLLHRPGNTSQQVLIQMPHRA